MNTVIKASRREFQLYLKKANEGDSYAQSWIGNALDLGLGVRADLAQALKWHKIAAKNGEAYSQAWLGWAFDQGKVVKKSLKGSFAWYKRAALQGYANGEYCVGQSYSDGQGIAKNLKLAVKWWRRAAKHGYAPAQCNLGKAYEDGEGVRKNLRKAKKLYQAAARQGDAIARFNLARLKLASGLQKQAQNEFRSIIPILKKTIRKKDSEDHEEAVSSLLCLGDCAYFGWGMKINKEQARKWYRQAARPTGSSRT